MESESCTPFNEVIALDPGDGHELWRFDPKIATDYRPANLFTCRGVAFWRDSGGAAGPCATRVLTVTNDARLIALDLETGRRCAEFGQEGEVRIEPGKPLLWPGEWQMTSAPTVFADRQPLPQVTAAGLVIAACMTRGRAGSSDGPSPPI